MAKKAVDDMKAKIEQLRLQLNGAMPTAHQLMENLGISENIANLVLQRMFVESPNKATAASEDSGSATSKGGMPNKKAKAAEPGSMPRRHPRPRPLRRKGQSQWWSSQRWSSLCWLQRWRLRLRLPLRLPLPRTELSTTLNLKNTLLLLSCSVFRQSARSPDEEDTQVWHRGATQEPVPQAPSAINNCKH